MHNYFLLQLVATNGYTSPRVTQDMTHNRTCNKRGGAGRNIAMDLQCEHSNKQFQGILYKSLCSNDLVHIYAVK